MYLVVLHPSGRIDAERLSDLCERTALMVRAGLQPPMHSVLGVCDTLPAAATKSAEWRAVRRNQGEERRDMSNAVKWLIRQRIRFLRQQARDTRLIQTADQDERAWYQEQASKIELEIAELERFDVNATDQQRPGPTAPASAEFDLLGGEAPSEANGIRRTGRALRPPSKPGERLETRSGDTR